MKKPLRQQLRERMQRISADQCEELSRQACDLLRKQEVFQRAKCILFYAPFANELNIWPLLIESLAADKTVALPGFDAGKNLYVARQIRNLETDLRSGHFGIREPRPDCPEISLKRLDLALVPGVGFDLAGGRLGRGKGFYDRLLAHISGTKCGVGFDEQIVEAVPIEPHDVSLNCILTPTRCLLVEDRR